MLSSDNTRSEKNIAEDHDAADSQHQLDDPIDTPEHRALTPEQKELKKVRKRIIKPVRELLEKASAREAELKCIPVEENPKWAEFDALLEDSVQTNGALPTTENDDNISPDTSVSVVAGASPSQANSRADEDVDMVDDDDDDAEGEPDEEVNGTAQMTVDAGAIPAKGAMFKPMQPLSPPNSTSSVANTNNGTIDHPQQELAPPPAVANDPWAQGGVPWYLELFDIDGTTIHEERWSGRDAMSEELTDLDEEEVAVLCDKPSASVEADDNAKSRTRSSARIKRAEENSTTSNEEENASAETQQTEEQRAERERKDKANARRRAQRRRKW